MREKLGFVLALTMFVALMVAPATAFAQRGCYHECAREYRHCEDRCTDLRGHHRKDCIRECQREQRHCDKDCERRGYHR